MWHSFESEYEVAERLIVPAGVEMSRQVRRMGSGGSVAAARDAARRMIVAGLREEFPRDLVLWGAPAEPRIEATRDRVWCVRALDADPDSVAATGEFAVLIGLMVTQIPVLGLIYLPSLQVLYSAVWPSGVRVGMHDQNSPLVVAPPTRKTIRLLVHRSTPELTVRRLRQVRGIADVSVTGSVGMACALLLEGTADAYFDRLSFTRGDLSCAPLAILNQAGLAIMDWRGRPLDLPIGGGPQPGGILVSHPHLLEGALTTLAGID